MSMEQSFDLDAELARFEAQERERLGLGEREHWKDRMLDPIYTAKERPKTTLLLAGLTRAQDSFIEAALNGIGYRVRALDCPDNEALRFGKEFGNRAQCNPTYYTVGNLVKELTRLRDEEGLSTEEIIKSYLFITVGACGPCRFGMYVTEYRKALRDAGFDGFRVMLFQQTGGIKQATGEELGLVLNPTFFFAIARAVFVGDVVNQIGYRLRPYEIEKGSVDRALEEVKAEIHEALSNRSSLLLALWRGRRILARVPIDRSQLHPKVSVIGEFWAMTTEGDGSYHLQRFLEQEGAEVYAQCVANTLLYNIWEFRHDTEQRIALAGADGGRYGLKDSDPARTLAWLWFADIALRVVWQSYAKVLGLHDHVMPNMEEIAELGGKLYNVELRGGEGHLEVGKLIMNVVKSKAHMTVSVKPFGCMPSSGVSDGVQSAVTELHPDAIYCAVETSGDGAVNFYSRVQMYLFKARQRAKQEYEEALAHYGITEEELRAFLKGRREQSPFHLPPHRAAGTTVDLIHEVAPLMGKGRLGRLAIHAGRAIESVRKLGKSRWPQVESFRRAAPYLPALAREAASGLVESLPAPKQAWQKVLDRFVQPSEDEKQQIERAEVAETMRTSSPAPKRKAETELRVVA